MKNVRYVIFQITVLFVLSVGQLFAQGTTQSSDNAATEITIKARYRPSRICVMQGDVRVFRRVDCFEVTEVLRGSLKATSIVVRLSDKKNASYPKELSEGRSYTLTVTLSDKTKKESLEIESKTSKTLFIDAAELAEIPTEANRVCQ